jgi:hypothetical protein
VRVRRTLVTYFVKVEEAGIRDAFLAEGLQAIAAIVGEEPACAEGDGLWSCRDLAG